MNISLFRHHVPPQQSMRTNSIWKISISLEAILVLICSKIFVNSSKNSWKMRKNFSKKSPDSTSSSSSKTSSVEKAKIKEKRHFLPSLFCIHLLVLGHDLLLISKYLFVHLKNDATTFFFCESMKVNNRKERKKQMMCDFFCPLSACLIEEVGRTIFGHASIHCLRDCDHTIA